MLCVAKAVLHLATFRATSFTTVATKSREELHESLPSVLHVSLLIFSYLISRARVYSTRPTQASRFWLVTQLYCRRDCATGVTFALLLSVTVSAPEYLHVSLGAAVGKVTTGSHTTAGFKEDKRNKATPGTKTKYQLPTPKCNLDTRVFYPRAFIEWSAKDRLTSGPGTGITKSERKTLVPRVTVLVGRTRSGIN